MSKRSRRNAQKKRQKNKKEAQKRPTSEPWLSQTTGLRAIGVLSLLLFAFMVWQLWPSEGPLRAILWGLGFAAAIWGVFFLSLAFNRWVRGNKKE